MHQIGRDPELQANFKNQNAAIIIPQLLDFEKKLS
jgi:hypothetical protein